MTSLGFSVLSQTYYFFSVLALRHMKFVVLVDIFYCVVQDGSIITQNLYGFLAYCNFEGTYHSAWQVSVLGLRDA